MASTAEISENPLLEYFQNYWVPTLELLNNFRARINSGCQSTEPVLLITYSIISVCCLIWLYNFIFQEESIITRAKKCFFRTIKRLPYVGAMIKAEMNKTLDSVRHSMETAMKGRTFILALPSKGKHPDEILKMVSSYHELVTTNPQEGHVSGTMYSTSDDEMVSLLSKIYGRHSYSNPLHPDLYQDVRKMEAEVVRMCLSMFHGGPQTCGVVSSGGTESIMLACKAYRNRAYDLGIKQPEMIVPTTAHAAFYKASHCFKIRLIPVEVDRVTWAVRSRDIRSKITRNTCLVVCSAPSYPHGIVDPVSDIAKMAKSYKIPVHVDCCLGGFLLPFMEAAGYSDLPPSDFRVSGVTSISCDTHKYGYAPKGSSVILYCHKDYRKYQYDVVADWSGGIYATSTFAGSRCGANSATCWASMIYIGEQGYVDRTRRIISVQRYIKQELKKMDHIYVLGDPLVSIVAIGSLDFNIYRLYDALTERGWHLNALQFPSCFHVCVTLPMTKPGVADVLINDVKESLDDIMLDPKAKCGGMGALYGMAQSIPDRSMVAEMCDAFLDAYYSTSYSHTNLN